MDLDPVPDRAVELLRVDVGQRREPEPGSADQLGRRPAGTEGHERSEDRIMGHAGEELDPVAHVPLDEDRAAHPRCGRAHRVGVRQPERDAAHLGLVRARGRDLDDDRVADLLRGDDGGIGIRADALLDTALRRRFSFVDFDPTTGPVSRVLPEFLAARHPQLRWVADVVHRANTILDDPLASIGPSHFLRGDLDSALVERIWTYDVLPTLREHLYGRRDVLEQLALEALRPTAAVQDSGADVDDA